MRITFSAIHASLDRWSTNGVVRRGCILPSVLTIDFISCLSLRYSGAEHASQHPLLYPQRVLREARRPQDFSSYICTTRLSLSELISSELLASLTSYPRFPSSSSSRDSLCHGAGRGCVFQIVVSFYPALPPPGHNNNGKIQRYSSTSTPLAY